MSDSVQPRQTPAFTTTSVRPLSLPSYSNLCCPLRPKPTPCHSPDSYTLRSSASSTLHSRTPAPYPRHRPRRRPQSRPASSPILPATSIDRSFNATPNYETLVNGSDKARASLLSDIRNGTATLSIAEFADVIIALTRARKVGDALSVMHLAEYGPLHAPILKNNSVKLYTIMIDIYGKAYQLSRAFSLFYGMTRNGIKPNTVTYNTMISACSRSNEPDLAYEVFEEMIANELKPDKFTFGSLIDSCAKCGQAERAFEISAMMDVQGVRKDQTVYAALMDACARTDQLERAFQLLEEMKRKSIWPNLVTFSVLIDTCANARQPVRAFQLFSEIKHWGFSSGNVIVFTALIDACAKSGWPERAEQVMKAMIAQGVEPNQISYGALMEAWAKEGKLDRAFSTIENMVSKHSLVPNAVVIGGLIDATRRWKDTAYISKLWDLIVKYNIRPSKTYYPPMIAMAIMENEVRIATAIVLHAYARGSLRRAALNSEDPALHAIACAMIYYRHEILLKGRTSNATDAQKMASKRMGTVFRSIAMSEKDMDSMPSSEAQGLCMSWGDADTRDWIGVRHRNGSRRDKKGVFRRDSKLSAEARRAKDDAAAGKQRGRHRLILQRSD